MDQNADAYDVIIAGAGPTGLMLAGELALAGVRCRVVERREHRTQESRALGLHGRTMEVLHMRGVADEVLERANPVPRVRVSLGQSLFDMGKLVSDFGQLTIIPQGQTEELLEKRAVNLGVTVERGVTVTDCRQEGRTVHVTLEKEGRVWEESAPWLIGCDGSRSQVRQSMGAEFTGATYPYTIIVADVRLGVPLDDQLLIRVGRAGLVVATDFGNGWYRMGVIDRDKPWSDDPVTLGEVDATLKKLFGRDMRPSEPLWTSRFHIQERQAEFYRKGRMIIAGDAAHVHSPLGGQGLNLGIQDAMNLGWKLAAVVKGRAGEDLLDSYAAERRPVSQGVIKVTDIATRIMTSDQLPARVARKAVVAVASRIPRTHLTAVGHLSGVFTRYPAMAAATGASALVGTRVPDLRIASPGRSAENLYEALRTGSFVLIDTGSGAPLLPGVPESDGSLVRLAGRISYAPGPWRTPEVILVRPDGYCAWAGTRARAVAELPAALLRWVRS
ncbi:3-(3-hydroxy-phenyl)propionate/3-hydroxycinnamic acid hydroxylase Short=3-HPP hydroxylase [Streptomyces davaonensis JCM 4913]|uniref:3-(3-hydroxy-phenyl)propionate/3-hydroxycinnamic acid hydroxylase Short=3-HPP hydroxylase n=1 Tax=Streptomyces davaonensis (strain DSM 101723 / JCM 4913 / KCC S-0913 / 768) TaxID=1214101 RepID=K4R1A8_STRDJ|nr:FAD-dependent monooxygenase [Streptomyces davaonensis]CCK26860.1 3-(3-hydroxy-phenyl)propionate/3-hydroxycinnamic acid hydroxylase Short=3-HPP hydroxylase [Streptomyces davaonensis JCM 4913]